MADNTETPELYDYPARQIQKKLAEELGDMFHAYFYGDPVAIGKSLLPACIVEWEKSDPLQAPTRTDKWNHRIVIKIVLNKMDDTGISLISGSRLIDTPTKARMERMVMARDAVTKDYIQNCVLGVLRRNFTMQGGMIDNKAAIQFWIAPRPDDRGVAFPAAECHITLQAAETIRVNDRS